MTVSAVVFDWGGTLTPWHDIDLVAQWYAYAQAYDPTNAHALAQRLHDHEISAWRRQADTEGAIGTGALDAIFLAEGIDLAGARHLRALATYLDFWTPHTLTDPEAAPLLRALRADGIRIGVLSNTMWPRAHHQEVFARDDIDDLIDAAVYTSELAVGKPHADAFGAILDALGASAADAVFVGDRLVDDVLGAQRVGMRAVWIPHSRIPDNDAAAVTPDATIDRLADLVGVLAAWR